MNMKGLVVALALSCVIILGGGNAEAGKIPPGGATATLLAPALAGGGLGSAIGLGGVLYVTEPGAGKIWSVDPKTGARTLFASGLPKSIIGLGGVMDVAFIGKTAYALVTLVGPQPQVPFPGGNPNDVVGIYRVDGPNSFTVIANIGAFSMSHPPNTPFFVPSGLQYALEPYRGGFLVTDGHHNRVLKVGLDGSVTQLIQFGDIVPTGLAVSGNTVYMAEAGPLPHEPQDGKVVSFETKTPTPSTVASGGRLLVDVEFGRGRDLFALAQGVWSGGPNDAGSPAQPNTGSLLKVNSDGTFTHITDGLNQPTSLEFIGNTAYVVTLRGEIWKIDDVSGPPHGE